MEGIDIGALAGRIEFEDHVTSTLDLVMQKVDMLEEKFGGMGHRVAESAAGFFTAEAAMKALEKGMDLALDVIRDVTTEGAAIADVEENFEHLATGIGRVGATMLGALKEGTHNTITDFELMKTLNQDLAANMALTDDQFKGLAKGAFALAQATGGDVKTAFDTVNDAMLTGRTRALQLLTGRIDLAQAEVDYAVKLNTTVDKLNAEQKLFADRGAIMEAVNKATGRLGEQTDGLDEKIAQLTTAFKNNYEEFQKGVASSPSVIHAFDAIRDALVNAFGGDSQDLVQTAVHWVNNIADSVAVYGPIVINGFVQIKDWVMEVYHSVIDTWDALPSWLKTVAERTALTTVGLYAVDKAVGAASSSITDLIGTAGNLTTTFSGIPTAFNNITGAVGGFIGLMKTFDFTSFAAAGASLSLMGEAAIAAIGPLGAVALAIGAIWAAWEVGKTAGVSDFFEKWELVAEGMTIKEAEAAVATHRLTDAQAEQAKGSAVHEKAMKEAADAADKAAEKYRLAAEAARQKAEDERKDAEAVHQTAEEQKKMHDALEEIASAGKDYHDTLKGIDETTLTLVRTNMQAGVSANALATAYNLTATQIKAVEMSLKDEKKAMELEQKQLSDSQARWAEYHSLVTSMSGSQTERTIADIEKWKAAQIKAHKDAKTDTADFYDWLGMTETAMYDKSEQQRLLADTHSKAHYDQIAKDAREAYEFAAGHADQFTTEYIKDLKQTSDAAAEAAKHWRDSLGGALDDVSGKVRTLSGEMISLQEKADRLRQGNTQDVTSQNFEQKIQQLQTNGGFNPTGQGNNYDFAEATKLAKLGYSFQEIKDIFDRRKNGATGAVPPPHGPRIPGFREGGIGDFGDGTLAMLHDKEAIIPLKDGGLGLGNVTNHFYVNGTAADVARKISEEIMRTLKSGRQFGSA